MLIFLIYLVCMSLKNVVIRCMKNTDSSLKFLGEEKPSSLVFGEETLSCLEVKATRAMKKINIHRKCHRNHLKFSPSV